MSKESSEQFEGASHQKKKTASIANKIVHVAARPSSGGGVYIHMYVVPLGSVWQFWGFSGLSSKSSLFYSDLRLPAVFEMTHHKPTKCLFLQ